MRRIAVLLITLVLAACGTATTSSSSTPAVARTKSVTVFAAASLQDVFTALAGQFEQAHPDTKVVLSFGGSSSLAQQINSGAPVDVFAAASEATMDTVAKAGNAEKVTLFAANKLTIATPKDNKAGIASLSDLAKPQVKLALCAVEVPCGAAAATVAKKANLTFKPVTQEQDVKAVLTKVSLGEVDAGLVYVTDVIGANVASIAIPDDVNAITRYPISVIKNAPNAAGADAFTQYILSADGQAALTKAGFAKP